MHAQYYNVNGKDNEMKIFVFLAFVLCATSSFAFDTFNEESKRITASVKCQKPKITPGNDTWGALYGCIGGSSETVKIFINEQLGSGQVENVKFMWNDWTGDGGYGLHADKALAKAWVSVFGTLYAPQKVDQVIKTFFGTKDSAIDGGSHVLKFTYRPGPGIDERLFVVVRKKT